MLVQNILHFFDNQCYFFMCTIFDYPVINLLSCPPFLLLTFLGDPRTRTTPWLAEHFTLVVGRPHSQRAATFDLYIQPSILYLIAASTPPFLPPFRARSRFSSCTRERPSRPVFPWPYFQRAQAHLYLTPHETYTPTRLRCWPQAPHTRYSKDVLFITPRNNLGAGVSERWGRNHPVPRTRRAIYRCFYPARRRTTTKAGDRLVKKKKRIFFFFFFPFCVSGSL